MSASGGPAFPVPDYVDNTGLPRISEYVGMSLHDWYVGMALQGIYANSELCRTTQQALLAQSDKDIKVRMADALANTARLAAHAVMAQRKGGV